MLADFANTTGDAVFDGTLKQALAVDLDQSPFLRVVPQAQVQKTLGFHGPFAPTSASPPIWPGICACAWEARRCSPDPSPAWARSMSLPPQCHQLPDR